MAVPEMQNDFTPPQLEPRPSATEFEGLAEIVKKEVKPDHHANTKASLIAMNYGEFTAFCEGIGADKDKVWAWATGEQA